MKLVDLTLPIQQCEDKSPAVEPQVIPLQCGGAPYEAVIYQFHHDSMAGTYIDFPGHIVQTDNGLSAANYPPEHLYRVRAGVIRLERGDGSGGISAQELMDAAPDLTGCNALVINALGSTRFDAIVYRSVYLLREAAEWIASTGIRLFVSDVYESTTLGEGVFPLFFSKGICTVCHPINLDRLDQPYATLTVLAPRFPGVTQLPCRIIAEL